MRKKALGTIVVTNHEQQYSIWPNDRQLPGGWKAVNIPDEWLNDYLNSHPEKSDKEICLAYIAETWVDMRPLSVRKFQEDQQKKLKGAAT